jgi:DNA-binding MarR family transcriptional regulator
MSMELPMSALIVLDFLTKKGPHSPKVISKKANLPLRTVSFALRHLRKGQLCRRIPNLSDMRQPLYIADNERARAVFLRYGKVPV